MSGMDSPAFTLQQGPVGAPLVVQVDSSGITTTQGKRTKRVNFNNLRDVFVAGVAASDIPMRWVEFVGRDGVTVMLAYTSFFDRAGQRRTFNLAVSQALSAYAKAQSGATVALGPGKSSNRRSMTLAGVMGIVVWVFVVLRDQPDVVAAVIALCVLLAAFVFVALTTFNVVKDPPRSPAEQVSAEFLREA